MATTYTDNGTNTPNGSHLIFSYTYPVLESTDVKVALNGVEYRGVTIGDVPNEYTQWFNYKGLTYIIF